METEENTELDLDKYGHEKKLAISAAVCSVIIAIFTIASGAYELIRDNIIISVIMVIAAILLFMAMVIICFGNREEDEKKKYYRLVTIVCTVISAICLIASIYCVIPRLIKKDGPPPIPVIEDPSGKIAAGNDFSMLLRNDKTVVTYGPATGINTSDWANITQIAAYKDHAIGLLENGSVIVTGAHLEEYHVSGWNGIQQVAACKNGVIGLTEDGEVEFAGPCYNCMIDCDEWSRVQKIIGAAEIIVAQKMDNTLTAVDERTDMKQLSLDSGRSIVSGTAVNDRILLVLDNGRIKLIGDGSDLEKTVANWADIKQVAVGIGFAVGLKQDGTAIPTGAPVDNTLDVFGWKNVAAICAGKEHVLGLCEDGTVVTAGNLNNGLGEIANVSYWVN